MNNGVLPTDLSGALVMNATPVSRLHGRIKELQQEMSAQRQLYRQARQQHVQLRNDLRDMEAKSQGQFLFTVQNHIAYIEKRVLCMYVCMYVRRVKDALRAADVQEVREAGGPGGSADSERQPEAGGDEIREASAGGSEPAGAQDVAGTRAQI